MEEISSRVEYAVEVEEVTDVTAVFVLLFIVPGVFAASRWMTGVRWQ